MLAVFLNVGILFFIGMTFNQAMEQLGESR